jgi:hypothetical protein
MRKFLSLLFLIFFTQEVFAQHTTGLGEDPDRAMIREFYLNNINCHTEIRPFVDADINGKRFVLNDSIILEVNSSRLCWKNYYQKPWDTTENYQPFDPGKTAFLIRPIYDFNVGYDLKSKRGLLTTIGGVILDADYKQKIGIEVRVAGGISALPNYLDSVAHFSGTMPGWGDRAYPNGNGKYSFQHLSGNMIWRPSKVFNLQIGRDKHFWGDGYRSLFLSDVGSAMPYMKLTTTIWKLQYTSLFTAMQDWTKSNGNAKDFRSKYGTFHYISFNATKWMNIGVFESIIWQGTNVNRMRGFDINYLNPIIFFRQVE